ncbi:MAG TPA: flagellar hook protein FlgE [Bacteroidota bacterium]|nr:flagellar hook protein FlgE [Bacteroidota bacterium]
MAFLRSLFSGVSGLRNHQTMMDVIGNNIANINTVGFKAGRTTFSELYAQTLRSGTQPVDGSGGTNPMQVGLGITVNSLDTLFTQGNIENTGKTTDLAVQGNGFFIVKKDGKNLYTRVGTFDFDSTGTLVNTGTGAIVQGKLADAQGNIPSGTTLEDVKVALDTKSPAKATSTMKFAGNLDSGAKVGDTANASVSVFDSLGNQHTITLTFTNTGTNAWSWKAAVPAPATTAAAGTVTFNTDGTLNSMTGNPLALTPGGGANAMSINVDFGTPSAAAPGNFSGLTQTAGGSTVTPREQDGYAAGTLSDISIDSTGKVQGTFSNGTVLTLAQIMMAEFNNPGGLVRNGENTYDISGNSGTAAIITPGQGSSVVSGALEQSNVDLADEFTRMITAQRGFQANARVITTSDEFLQEVVNLKR